MKNPNRIIKVTLFGKEYLSYAWQLRNFLCEQIGKPTTPTEVADAFLQIAIAVENDEVRELEW